MLLFYIKYYTHHGIENRWIFLIDDRDTGGNAAKEGSAKEQRIVALMAAVIIMIKKGGEMKIMSALLGVFNRQSLAVHQ